MLRSSMQSTNKKTLKAIKRGIKIPLIAAGGIATGRQMLAAMVLGADAVQIGSRFVCSEEASSHHLFKEAIIQSKEGDTQLGLKQLVPVRLLKNPFSTAILEAEKNGASIETLQTMLGKSRAKKGMFEGDMEEGELEIGQVSSLIKEIKPAAEIVKEIWNNFTAAASNPF